MSCGCQGSQMVDFGDKCGKSDTQVAGEVPSQLRQWPVQLHLINPSAPYYQGKDVLLTADCCAYSYGNFHNDFMKDKSIAVACPKLDSDQNIYVEKIRSWIDDAKINSLTVVIMQVPCCGGLLSVAKEGVSRASRKVPVKCVVLGLQGEVLKEEWV